MPAWIPALASSLHVALAVLRQHRSASGLVRVALVATAYAFALTPWLSSSSGVVIAWLIVHALWFALTDRVATARLTDRATTPPKTPSAARNSPAPPSIPRGFFPLPVIAVIDETPDVRTFRLARPPDLVFQAGQFLPVRLRVDSQEHVRCYSISSSPASAGYLEISVRRQGTVSSALHATLAPGSLLTVRPPGGAFVYPADDDRPLVLLAGGIGVTPLRSMALHAVATDPTRPVVLVQSAREPASLAFAEEFRVLQRRHHRFRWVTAVTGQGAGSEHYPGRIDEALLRLAVPELAAAVVCICGPGGMIDDLRTTLECAGVSADRVRFERFEAAIAAVGAQAAEELASAPEAGAEPVVTFSSSSRVVRAGRRESLLDVAERTGIEIPSLCRAGVCGTCRTRVVEGEVHCASQTLDAADSEGGYVLACVSHPVTDCTVEA